jgi:beta-phosphoglucomutase-like phosphatase (HAD superfamily)
MSACCPTRCGPREWHEDVFRRDGVLDLIDGAGYSSEIDWTKPHPEAFRAIMAPVGVSDPARCVFVGDRPFDDVHGAQRAGMWTCGGRTAMCLRTRKPLRTRTLTGLAELRPLIESWVSADRDSVDGAAGVTSTADVPRQGPRLRARSGSRRSLM